MVGLRVVVVLIALLASSLSTVTTDQLAGQSIEVLIEGN